MATPKKKRERKPTKERAKKKPLTLLVHMTKYKVTIFYKIFLEIAVQKIFLRIFVTLGLLM
jgi:hypothetical protein